MLIYVVTTYNYNFSPFKEIAGVAETCEKAEKLIENHCQKFDGNPESYIIDAFELE